jgi:hypothetical protein
MAALTKSNNKLSVLKRSGSKPSKEMAAKIEAGKEERKAEKQAAIEDHLPPLVLTCIILACSGFMLIFCMRDFWTTGKNIAGSWDEALLVRLHFNGEVIVVLPGSPSRSLLTTVAHLTSHHSHVLVCS